LVDSAIRLFAEKSFDDVTVIEIADSADVDASTFFRHFGSKEAVLFTDMVDFTERIGDALDRQPRELSVFDAIVAAIVDLGQRAPFDPEIEYLRATLTQSSPALQAQTLVYRERLVKEMARAIARRLDLDADTDAGPYLAATVWAATLEFYRQRAISTSKRPRVVDPALDDVLADVLDMLRPIWPAVEPWS
jgi:AcrR family transcriptional regulator